MPPFSLTRRDGRLFGLGLGNMKAAVAALAFACVFLQSHRDRWCGRVSFTAVPDETVFGPHGAAWLLDERPELLGDALICGEGPGGMHLSVAEKGVLWLAIEAEAPPGQGMLGRRGGSAVVRLARVIGALDALNELQATPPPPVAILADNAGEQGLRLSVNAGRIEGGGLISQVAVAARAEVDVRIPPGLTIADVEDRVDAITRTVEGTRWRRIKDGSRTGPSRERRSCTPSRMPLRKCAGARRHWWSVCRRATAAVGAPAASPRSATGRSPGSRPVSTTMHSSRM